MGEEDARRAVERRAYNYLRDSVSGTLAFSQLFQTKGSADVFCVPVEVDDERDRTVGSISSLEDLEFYMEEFPDILRIEIKSASSDGERRFFGSGAPFKSPFISCMETSDIIVFCQEIGSSFRIFYQKLKNLNLKEIEEERRFFLESTSASLSTISDILDESQEISKVLLKCFSETSYASLQKQKRIADFAQKQKEKKEKKIALLASSRRSLQSAKGPAQKKRIVKTINNLRGEIGEIELENPPRLSAAARKLITKTPVPKRR